MLAPRFRLTPANREDLALTCVIGESALARVSNKIETEKFTIRRSRIEQAIQEEIGSENGIILGRVLFGIAGTFRRSAVSADDALEGISQSINGSAEHDERFKNWNEIRAAIKRLLETRSIKLAAKALDISYDFERVFLTGRLLTSIRPVFDDQREDIVGSTIVQTLRLEYVGSNGDQSTVSISMDIDDIGKLKEECERAILKANSAQKKIEQDCAIDAIIPGEEIK